jgi:PTH2 family peptidyl-tRNA hydrolase
MNRYKQAIVIRKDLKMSCGKAIAQGCHASLESELECNLEVISAWRDAGYHKVVLAVISEEELVNIYDMAITMNLPAAIVTDFGLTQLEPGTKTAVGIGPARVEDINEVVGYLKLY